MIGQGQGGFEVGEVVIWTNPYGIDKHPGEIVALHRNGNLCVREPEFGTTCDVHHTLVEAYGRISKESRV